LEHDIFIDVTCKLYSYYSRLHNSLSAQLCRGSAGLNIETKAVLEAQPRPIDCYPTLRRLNQGSFVLVYFVSYSVAFLMV